MLKAHKTAGAVRQAHDAFKIIAGREAAGQLRQRLKLLWQWKGTWADEKIGKTANGAGAEVSFKFNGVGCMLVGELTQQGGRADVYVDGKKANQIEAYIPERTHDNALWHIFGLKNGEHTIKIVALDEADKRSKGKKVILDRAVIYRAR